MMLKTDPAGRFHAHKVLELPFWNLVLPSAPNSIMNAQDTGEDCEDNFAHSNSASVKGQPTKPASFSQKHDRAFVGRACNNTRLAKEFDLCKKPRLSGIRSYRSTSKGERPPLPGVDTQGDDMCISSHTRNEIHQLSISDVSSNLLAAEADKANSRSGKGVKQDADVRPVLSGLLDGVSTTGTNEPKSQNTQTQTFRKYSYRDTSLHISSNVDVGACEYKASLPPMVGGNRNRNSSSSNYSTDSSALHSYTKFSCKASRLGWNLSLSNLSRARGAGMGRSQSSCASTIRVGGAGGIAKDIVSQSPSPDA